jgi:LPS-assembly lipoprotein
MDIRHWTLAVALFATACGFHWAGSRPLPPALASVYIDVVTPYRVSKPPLEGALSSRLLRRGARLTGSLTAAHTILRITDLKETREVLSVDPFGKAVEFKLTTRITWTLVSDGGVLLTPDTIQVSRDYSFNAQQVLAKEAEEARLQAFMQDELAELLLLRLEALLAAPPTVPAGSPP